MSYTYKVNIDYVIHLQGQYTSIYRRVYSITCKPDDLALGLKVSVGQGQ